jgi:hypothetical protein
VAMHMIGNLDIALLRLFLTNASPSGDTLPISTFRERGHRSSKRKIGGTWRQ